METLSLQKILEAFSAPINEEQAWAVCHQCCRYLQRLKAGDLEDCRRDGSSENPQVVEESENGDTDKSGITNPGAASINLNSVTLGADGNVTSVYGFSKLDLNTADMEQEMVHSLGIIIFQALDYGLSETEEQKLSPLLESLIERMTGSDSGEQNIEREADGDEGIEDDNEDKDPRHLNLSDVIQACVDHTEKSVDASAHYKAVCRALVAEAIELTSFLEKVSSDKERLKLNPGSNSENGNPDLSHLQSLRRTDWARLWMQIMRELRQGVKLKKVQTTVTHPVEYELTPYEILMDDVRYRRYTLNKVPLTDDLMPLTVKKDVHALILDFIRSRPPLHSASRRVLTTPPHKSLDVREQLMVAIRSEPQLKPTPGRIVETSRTRLDESDSTPAISRKVIKPDMTLLLMNSFDDEVENFTDEDEDEEEKNEVGEDKSRVTAEPHAPFTPLSPKSPPKHLPWQHTDAPNQQRSERRRSSITVCQSPTNPSSGHLPNDSPSLMMGMDADSIQCQVDKFMAADFSNLRSLQSTLECLSLTVEEVMHIRNVLTKAELECLSVNPELYSLLANGKICFACKKTKFSLFGTWATKCKFCFRSVCSKCISKMHIPTEHFEHIPVYTLSPSPGSPTNDLDYVAVGASGSVPSSPDFNRRPLTPPLDTQTSNRSAVNLNTTDVQGRQTRAPFLRSKTIIKPQSSTIRARALEGPMMNICRDCRGMIVNIIKASRRSLALAPPGTIDKVYSNCPSRRASRNFHLDLKPVYKGH